MLKVLLGILSGAVVAFILSLIGLDTVIIKGITALFHIQITKEIYYFIFIVIGFVVSLLKVNK